SDRSPSEPICKHSIVETTKPPAYPFIIINVKERDLRRNNNRISSTSLSQPTAYPSDLPATTSRFRLPRCGEGVFRQTRRQAQERKCK
ncbi:hypothetical protein, partial [Falsigemmobacter intermedius]|uniref:hypothetical protein n=1 Tax=Falsigemmobacter intermedius TaxID=1553448 RepID=UPI0035E55217